MCVEFYWLDLSCGLVSWCGEWWWRESSVLPFCVLCVCCGCLCLCLVRLAGGQYTIRYRRNVYCFCDIVLLWLDLRIIVPAMIFLVHFDTSPFWSRTRLSSFWINQDQSVGQSVVVILSVGIISCRDTECGLPLAGRLNVHCIIKLIAPRCPGFLIMLALLCWEVWVLSRRASWEVWPMRRHAWLQRGLIWCAGKDRNKRDLLSRTWSRRLQ